MATKKDLIIQQGKTNAFYNRWETEPIVYKAITAIVKGAPTRLTVPLHGLVNSWRGVVVSVKGMKEINAKPIKPNGAVFKDSDYHKITVIDANTIEINDINSAEFTDYVSGGYIQYNTPHELTGYTARMKIRDKVGGTELVSLTTENGKLDIDEALFVTKMLFDAVSSATYTWKGGVYDLEMVSPLGEVTVTQYGKVKLNKEITV